MKMLGRLEVEEDGGGSVTVVTEESEDAWHLLNLVNVGDYITATIVRKVKLESGAGTVSASKKQLRLVLKVKNVEFDNKTGSIRFGGVNTEENEYVKMGQHHTVEIDAKEKEKIKICKLSGGWDSYAREYLDTACSMEKTAEVMVLLVDEACGAAYLYAIGDVLIRDVFRVNVTISRKHNEKQIANFHENVCRELMKHVDFENVVKCLVVAGPGFGKDNLHKYMVNRNSREGSEFIREYKSKSILGNASSIYKHSLHEILADPKFQARIISTKTATHTTAIENFCHRLQVDPDRVCYGFQEVVQAIEEGAVSELLVLDKLIRDLPTQGRLKFVKLMDNVKHTGGKVLVFSEKHVSGELLKQMTGAAATLRWPISESA